MDNIFEQVRKKVSSLKFPGKPDVEIPNDPLSAEKSIKTGDIYFDHSLKQMLDPENPIFFPQPSTDDRRDFEVNVSGDDFIVFKLPALTTLSIAKKDFKNSLEKVIEDLGLNLTQVKMNNNDRQETKQKINIIKKIIKRFDSTNKQNIEKQVQTHQWIRKLIEDQIQANKTYYTFDENFENSKLRKERGSITVRKRKLLPLTSEERLKDLPSIYAEIPTDWVKNIEAAKEFFSNMIKQVSPESYKKNWNWL